MGYGNKESDELTGFMRSRIILTAADLDLFTELDRKSRSAEELAADLSLDVRATTRVLDCLVVTALLAKAGKRYRLTPGGAPFSNLHSESILPMVQHMSNVWDNWSNLTSTLRAGKNPNLKPVIGTKDEKVMRAFIGAMDVVGRDLSHEIAEQIDLSTFSMLLDIGGGPGTYTLAFLEKNPQMQAVIFDFPDVLALARERIGGNPLAGRICFAQGDFYKDELPSSCDCALLSAIIHQNNPQQNTDLFRKIHTVLSPGGCIIIRDHIMDESRTNPPSGAFFAITMLVATLAGDTYTFPEVKDMLEQAGFSYVQLLETGERMNCLVQARKT